MEEDERYVEVSTIRTTINSASIEQGDPNEEGKGLDVQKSKWFGKDMYRMYATMGEGNHDFQMDIRKKDLNLFIDRLKEMMKDD